MGEAFITGAIVGFVLGMVLMVGLMSKDKEN
jgi:hypothetical protein